MDSLLTLFGKLHPLVLHFPIALLIFAALLDAARLRWREPTLGRCVALLATGGAIGAFFAALTGWVFAAESTPMPTLRATLFWHRWLGVATAVLALVAASLAWRHANALYGPARWLRVGALWLCASIVGVTGHLGGALVWGDDFFVSDS
jgi:uncharacterized membrane protein